MTKWIKILGVAGVVFIAVAVSVAVLVTQYDYNNLKPVVTKLVKTATGRDLVINGDLRLAVSLSPTLTVTDVALSNAPWGEKGDMVRLDQLAAKVDLMGLLQGQVSVDYLELDGLNVTLQTDGKGRANWEFEAPGAVAAEPVPAGEGDLQLVPSARDIRLKNVDVTYIDGSTGKRLHVMLKRADFTAENFTAPMHATLMAAYQGVVLDAVVDMGSLAHLVGSGGGPFPVKMNISATGLNATIEGTVDQPQAGMSVDARIHLELTDSTTLAALADVDLPALDDVTMTMKVVGGGAQYAFSAIDAQVGDSDLGGDITVKLAGARPRVSGKLTSKVLDLDQILGIETPAPAAQGELRSSGPEVAKVEPEGDAPRLFSSDPLVLDAFTAADLDLSVLAGRVKAYNLSFEAIKAGMKLDGGKLALTPLSLSVEDSDIDAALTFDTAAKTPTMTMTATVIGLDIGRVLKTMGQGDFLTLPVSAKVKLDSAGSSVQGLVAALGGSVRFSGRNGTINDTTITSLIGSLGNKLPWVQNEQTGHITCMVADWPVKGGVATAETVLLDTPGFAVAVTGNVDLGGELFHLTVVPKAKTTSLASFAVPVRIKGALSAPRMDVDPKDALLGTVGNVFKAPTGLLGTVLGIAGKTDKADATTDPCIAALGAGQAQATPAPEAVKDEPAPVAEPKAEPLKPVKDLGKALEGLFGK